MKNLAIGAALVCCIFWLSLSVASAGERRYTVQEIDDLRQAVEMRYLWGTTNLGDGNFNSMSRSYKEEEKAKVVEEQVRTYMIAGKTAKDLYNADKKKR